MSVTPTILIATHNQGKLREILEVLATLPYQFVSLDDLGITEDVEEIGVTHEDNALLKAQFFQAKTGLPTIAEDSGIYVDAFPGDFGVYTRRWKGLNNATDQQWIELFLNEIKKIEPANRTARFVCYSIFLADGKAPSYGVIGETGGMITDSLQAPLIDGIPISSCFIPHGSTQVYATLSVEEKNKISHRGKAMHQLKEYLRTFYENHCSR